MSTLPLVWHKDGARSRVLTGSAQHLLRIPDSKLCAPLPGGRTLWRRRPGQSLNFSSSSASRLLSDFESVNHPKGQVFFVKYVKWHVVLDDVYILTWFCHQQIPISLPNDRLAYVFGM